MWTEEESARVRQMVEQQKQSMNLNAVRLCFQAYLPDDNGCFTKALPPCISDAVYDSSEINNIHSVNKYCRYQLKLSFPMPISLIGTL